VGSSLPLNKPPLLQHRNGLYFCLRFAIYTIPTFLALYAMHNQFIVPFTGFIAWLSHQALHTMGAKSWVLGASVGIPGFSVEIKNNC
jgi:hypothetical protein